ncbi:MAG TPA: gluconate 2-dehydrogenase subunit 3 family protein [Myxococcota bacterium]|nr:gluconate 2-dehydrogenase subunit 3 family protein [Myxococcota bacterium]
MGSLLALIGLLAAGALAAAGAARFWLGYATAPGCHALARREAAFLDAAAEAMFPPGGPLPSGRAAGVTASLDGYLALVPARMRRLMRLLFALVEHATLVFPAPPPRGRRRFSALSLEQRGAVLDGWRTSPLFPRRLVFTSLRALLTNGYVADPAVLAALGLTPYAVETPVVEADLLYPRIGQPRSAIRHRTVTAPSDGRPLAPDGPRLTGPALEAPR